MAAEEEEPCSGPSLVTQRQSRGRPWFHLERRRRRRWWFREVSRRGGGSFTVVSGKATRGVKAGLCVSGAAGRSLRRRGLWRPLTAGSGLFSVCRGRPRYLGREEGDVWRPALPRPRGPKKGREGGRQLWQWKGFTERAPHPFGELRSVPVTEVVSCREGKDTRRVMSGGGLREGFRRTPQT